MDLASVVARTSHSAIWLNFCFKANHNLNDAGQPLSCCDFLTVTAMASLIDLNLSLGACLFNKVKATNSLKRNLSSCSQWMTRADQSRSNGVRGVVIGFGCGVLPCSHVLFWLNYASCTLSGPSAVGLSPSTVPEGMSPGVDSDTLDTPTKRRGQDQSGVRL